MPTIRAGVGISGPPRPPAMKQAEPPLIQYVAQAAPPVIDARKVPFILLGETMYEASDILHLTESEAQAWVTSHQKFLKIELRLIKLYKKVKAWLKL